MNSFYPAATIILAEICIALLVLSGIMIFMSIRNKRRNQAALSQLTEKLKQNENDRLSSLKTTLKDIYHYADDKIDELAAGIIKTEIIFYQGLMDILSSRNGASVENFDEKINPIIDAYRNLAPQTNPSADGDNATVAQDSDSAALKSELHQLKAENDKLSNELNTIKGEINETNAEFTRAFTGRLKNDVETESTADDTAEIPDEIVDTPETSETPQEKAGDAAATAEATKVPQSEPAPSLGQDDDDDDVLKDFNIDLGDINLDDNDAEEQKNEISPSGDEGGDNIDIVDNNIDESAIDELLNETSGQAGPDNGEESGKAAAGAEKSK